MESNGKKKKIRQRGLTVSSTIKKRLHQLRLSANLTVEELADKAGVSERTIRNLENIGHSQEHYDVPNLKSIAEVLGVSLIYLINGEQKSTKERKDDIDYSFEYLVEQFMEIDQNLLMVIRDHKHASREIIERQFWDCVFMRLKERNISLEHLDKIFRNPIYRNALFERMPKQNLTVEVAENFSRILYVCNTGEELLVETPELLWDCHCDTPTIEKQNYKCPIHSKPANKEVDTAFKSGYVMIKYGDLQFFWQNSRDLWPPSIDSFHMLDMMKGEGLFSKRYSSVLDIGSGTGFLGIVAAMKNPYINKVVLSDWLLAPYLYGSINWYLNRKYKQQTHFKANVGLFTNGLDPATMPYDVAICNPPYIPLLDKYEDIGMEATVAGTDLLKNVIIESKSIAKKTYIQFSNLAKDEAKEAADKAGVRLAPLGKERLVPFRLRILWDRPNYLEELVKKKGLIDNSRSRHRFWHKVQTYVIE